MDNKLQVAFAAIEKSFVDLIPKLEETSYSNRNFIYYGSDNLYPEYLYGLYNDVSSLKTIVDGTSDYVAGDDVKCNVPGFETEINHNGMTARELITLCARDYCIYGGFAIQIIRNKAGEIAELYYLDFRYCRCDKRNEAIYYNEDFGKKWGRVGNSLIYPKFVKEAKDVATSVFYYKNNYSTTYPVPKYSGALKACEIERHIDEFHLSALENGFAGSYMINFLQGIPTDEQKAEIERNVQEKFCSTKNAGRILLNFANGKDNAATLEKLEVEDFGEKYQAAAERAKEQIYTSFQASPVLFGVPNGSTGWNAQDFQEAFKLYNRTTVRAIQRNIVDGLDKIFDKKGSFTITPFTIDWSEEGDTEEVIETVN